MSSSTNTACTNLKFAAQAIAAAAAILLFTWVAQAQDLRLPQTIAAGSQPTVTVGGSGSGTFYLVGPGVSSKHKINLGEDFQIPPEELRFSGEYLAIACAGSCQSASFTVMPGEPERLSFLVHPSRVPVGQSDAVSGVAFSFDRFGNLNLSPLNINFRAAGAKESLFSRDVPTRDGVAWFRTSSGRSAGVLHIDASVDGIEARRVLEQVASEPCNLHITGDRTTKGIAVETAPVRDCAGNPVPDGTIVTFTATGSSGKSTVDAPVKGDVARARLVDPGPVVVSAASGVAMGNELRIAGRP